MMAFKAQLVYPRYSHLKILNLNNYVYKDPFSKQGDVYKFQGLGLEIFEWPLFNQLQMVCIRVQEVQVVLWKDILEMLHNHWLTVNSLLRNGNIKIILKAHILRKGNHLLSFCHVDLFIQNCYSRSIHINTFFIKTQKCLQQ